MFLTDVPTNVPEVSGNHLLVTSKLSTLYVLWWMCALGWIVSNNVFKTVSSFNFSLIYAFSTFSILNSSSFIFFSISNSSDYLFVLLDDLFFYSPFLTSLANLLIGPTVGAKMFLQGLEASNFFSSGLLGFTVYLLIWAWAGSGM